MADSWRSNYLARRGLGDEATETEMEEEFWRLVGPDPPEDDVKVGRRIESHGGVVFSAYLEVGLRCHPTLLASRRNVV